MIALRHAWCPAMLAAGMLLAGCSGRGTDAAAAATASAARPGSASAAMSAGESSVAARFVPPPDDAIADNRFGALVREGERIFTHTRQYAGNYAGNELSCSNCHLDAGRRPDSAPLWAAYVRYPRYRAKNDQVNSYAERLQGCFRFSMNGKPPPADSDVIKALTAYSYWLARGAPTGKDLAGQGYPALDTPPETPDAGRGKKVYWSHCALCHGDDGQGQSVAGRVVFPPLWGPESFNWGAGMHRVNTAAAFIQANMPFSRGGTLSDQQAWDVAMYMDSHERPQDPRFTGDVAQTRERYHDSRWSLYGKTVHGHVLGSGTGGGGK